MRWHDVQYRVVPVTDPRLVAVTEALQLSYTNGGVVLRIFEPTCPEVFDAASKYDLQGHEQWLRCFLEASSVRRAVREFRIPVSLPQVPAHIWYGGFEFEGAITGMLLSAGAYTRPAFDEEVARRLSREFVDALVGERRLTSVWRIDEPWTDWFYDVAWDATFVIHQHHSPRLALLCATDTD